MTIYDGSDGIVFGYPIRKKEETKSELEKMEEELDENGEQKWHVLDDSDLMCGGEV